VHGAEGVPGAVEVSQELGRMWEGMHQKNAS
jgi:hypothetical protein